MGTLQVVEGISSLAGLFIYNTFLTKTPYRTILWWIIVIGFFAALTPLMLVTHTNRKLGLSDSWFVVTDSALLAGVGQVGLMPLLVLGAQTCPKAVEGTLYAMLMSILNIGGVASDSIGGLLTFALGITANDFSNLWILVLICAFGNLIPVPFLTNLVPTSEELDRFHREQSTENERKSLLGEDNGEEEDEDDHDKRS